MGVTRALGVRGLVIECEDCREPHYFDWDLLRGNLRHLLDSGRPRVHEPAFNPDPDHYVTWEYARGYADGIHDALADAAVEDGSSAAIAVDDELADKDGDEDNTEITEPGDR